MASTSSRVACVWGANGISGSAMIRVLVEQSRQEWSRIICISRRPTLLDIDDDRIYFLAIDITEASVDDLLRELGKMGGESITDVFYYAYIAKQDETELDDVNKRLLQKALDVTVRLAGAQIRCFSLQTGYKYYGVHKGGDYLAPSPYREDAPRHRGLNFYYTQEDLLKEYANKHHWKYVITRPNIIIGVSKGNFMNFAVTLALYASIQRENGQPLLFPGNALSWNAVVDHSDALNNARFQLWSSVNDRIKSEAFNIHNGDEVTFRALWPKFEKYFGFPHHEQTFPDEQGLTVRQMSLLKFSVDQCITENKETWQRLAKIHRLDAAALDYGTGKFVDFVLGRTFGGQGDLSKAREYGWNTVVETSQSYLECFDQLRKMKIIP